MHRGYIKLWRKLRDNPMWLSEKFTRGQAWVDLLLLANHKKSMVDIRGIVVELEPGQVLGCERYLSKRWLWSRGKVRRFLQFLVQQTEPQISLQKNNVSTVISILNWNTYQQGGTPNRTTDDTTDGPQTDHRRTTDGPTEECINTTSTTNTTENETPLTPQRGPVCPYSEIQDKWNRLAQDSRLPACQVMNDARKRKIQKYWRQEWFRSNWREIFASFHADGWRKENPQHATFDVFFQKNNPEKYLEAGKGRPRQNRPHEREQFLFPEGEEIKNEV
jgi:hypothetical protein